MDISRYHELKYYSSWLKCSYDCASDESMLMSEERIIDFDRVKTNYLNNLGKSEECAASVDALGVDDQGIIYFIEFKNGIIDKNNIRDKVTESILIFHDITHTTCKDTRNNSEFILVYNPEKNQYRPQQKRAMNLARLGKTSCELNGLDRFSGVWVKNAYMMTARTFSEKMVVKIKA